MLAAITLELFSATGDVRTWGWARNVVVVVLLKATRPRDDRCCILTQVAA